MLRVLAIGPLPPPYHGVATFLRDLLASPHMGRAGVELRHLDTSDRRDASNLGRWDAENLRLGFANLAELAGQCRRSDANIVYLPLSQNAPAFLRDALFIGQARLMGKRVVVHLHGGYFRTLYDEQPGAFQAIVRGTLSCVSAAVVLGEGFRAIFAGLMPADRIHVVENGVPDAFADPPPRQTDRPQNSSATLLYMSTLTRTKGILELLEALALLRARPIGPIGTNVRLRVAGEWQEPELRGEALALIERSGLRDSVEFTGNVTGAAKTEFLNSGDIFCLPTRYPYEGQPLVLLEAMSAGLPLLTTGRGVIAATVGAAGVVLKPAAPPREIGEALHAMLSDRAKLNEYARAARERYLFRYTLPQCHASLARVFQAAAQ